MHQYSIADCTVVIPAKNEEATIENVVLACLDAGVSDVIVVDDGSADTTRDMALAAGARVVRHPYSVGNGGAVKTGARESRTALTAFMDADGQHSAGELKTMIERINEGYGMVVGARDSKAHASMLRRFGNAIYNKLASWIVGHKIGDLTSGFRVVRTEEFRRFLFLLPNGFSYPTTSTMAFFRSGYRVAFEPIVVHRRSAASSHIRIVQDGVKFLLIIFRITALYSPLKVFAPVATFFLASGIGYYAHTFLSDGRFTNFGAVLFISAILVFLIGLISEQITSLIYINTNQAGSSGSLSSSEFGD